MRPPAARPTGSRARLRNEDGIALIIALMAMMLLMALGGAVVMVSRTETMITANYRNSQEALYAADAGVERVFQDLLMIPRWNDILSGAARSSFIDGGEGAPKTLPAGGTVTLCCGAGTATGQLQTDSDALGQWGANNPQWKLFAWGQLDSLLPGGQIDSPMYLVVWVADDPSETDGNPLVDANGVLTVRAEAFGPSGTRKTIEATIARTPSTEIERGQIAQRGQEELNQRARKSAVQTPGKALTGQSLDVATGGIR